MHFGFRNIRQSYFIQKKEYEMIIFKCGLHIDCIVDSCVDVLEVSIIAAGGITVYSNQSLSCTCHGFDRLDFLFFY